MISSFFSKTKPINYVVLATFLVLFYGFYRFYGPLGFQLEYNYALDILASIALVIEMLIINEIIRREKITGFSSYAMLFFVLLLVVFPESMLDSKVVFCNFFLLLSLWRLLSVKTIKNVKHKIFDASFFIGVASLFMDWALVFLILVFLVINLYDRSNFKNWFVPFIAVITLGILTSATFQLLNDSFFLIDHYRFQIRFLEESFTVFEILKSSSYLFLSLLIMILTFLKLRQKGGGKLLALRVLFFAFVLASVMILINGNGTSAALISLFPVSVFITNYLETFKQNRYKEVALVILMFLPFFVLAIQMSS